VAVRDRSEGGVLYSPILPTHMNGAGRFCSVKVPALSPEVIGQSASRIPAGTAKLGVARRLDP